MAAYIKFDGLEGECKDASHEGWSDLQSYSQGMNKPGEGTGATRRRGDVQLDDITAGKELDKSSPKLAEAVCKGKVFPTVIIHQTASYTDSGRVTFFAIEMTNVQVVEYSVDGSAEDVPTESLKLNFEEIKVTYTEWGSDGSSKGNVEYTWKVEEGTS